MAGGSSVQVEFQISLSTLPRSFTQIQEQLQSNPRFFFGLSPCFLLQLVPKSIFGPFEMNCICKNKSNGFIRPSIFGAVGCVIYMHIRLN